MTDENGSSKFHHSIKVPRLYKITSKLFEKLDETKYKNFTSSALGAKHPNKKAIIALLNSACSHRSEIDHLFVQSGLEAAATKANPYLIKILMVELLYGKKRLVSTSTPVRTVLQFENKLNQLLSQIQPSGEESLEVFAPKYVRVNTLHSDLQHVVEKLRKQDWKIVNYDKNSCTWNGFLSLVHNLSQDEFLHDYHVDNLLVFHPTTEWHYHKLQLDGTLIVQNKSSCLVSKALNPEPKSVIIDACAAPGMKTSHLASMLKLDCVIHAFDKDKDRCKTLEEMVRKFGVDSCITVTNQDFTLVPHDRYSDVEYILLDPSCSGSGIVKRDTNTDQSRLLRLQTMQKALLRHALGFPSVRKVVYSTCSLTVEENEEVVEEVYKEVKNLFKFEAVLKNEWETRGDERYPHSYKFLRTDPNAHFCNGFFIASFVRRKIPTNES